MAATAIYANAQAMPGASDIVTVVMPVFNALPYLDKAIESVLAQTHTDFRFAIYDDHSTDGSYERALDWAQRDPRITVSRGDHRLGPSGSSNAAAALATTDLVARMDADDVANPDRLALQVAVFRQRPDVVLVGSTFDMIDAAGKRIRRARPSRILGHASPLAHASIMYRRRDFDAVGGYRDNTDYFEDFDLYRRLAARGRLLVFARPLLSVRFAGQHPRLHDDREEVLHKIDRLYRGRPRNDERTDKIAVMAFYSVAILSILALQRPRMLGSILRRGSFAQPARAMKVVAIVGIAEVSPRLARALGHWASGVMEYARGRGIGRETVLEWSPAPNPQPAPATAPTDLASPVHG